MYVCMYFCVCARARAGVPELGQERFYARACVTLYGRMYGVLTCAFLAAVPTPTAPVSSTAQYTCCLNSTVCMHACIRTRTYS